MDTDAIKVKIPGFNVVTEECETNGALDHVGREDFEIFEGDGLAEDDLAQHE